LCHPAVYYLTCKSDTFAAFKDYKAWAENAVGWKIGTLQEDKGGEFLGGVWDEFLCGHGIGCEHSICDTPQQLGVAEQFNHTLTEGVMTALSQVGLSQTWWEDAANHFVYGRICLLSQVIVEMSGIPTKSPVH
jgi:hypothetical protein